MCRVTMLICSVLLIVAVTSVSAQSGRITTEQANAIKGVLISDAGWEPGAFAISSDSQLNRDGCRFFHASSPQILDLFLIDFAFLPDNALVGGNPDAAVTDAGAILVSCGADASGEWWAQIVQRFALGRGASRQQVSLNTPLFCAALERSRCLTITVTIIIAVPPMQSLRHWMRLSIQLREIAKN